MAESPHRPTPGAQLCALRLVGGLTVSVAIYWQGLDDDLAACPSVDTQNRPLMDT